MELGNIHYINREDFAKLQNSEDTEDAIWHAFCDTKAFYQINPLAGGLDHITITPNQVTFHDIGVSRGGGEILDNTFTIRQRKK